MEFGLPLPKVDLNALQEFIDPKFQPPIAFASGAYTTKNDFFFERSLFDWIRGLPATLLFRLVFVLVRSLRIQDCFYILTCRRNRWSDISRGDP